MWYGIITLAVLFILLAVAVGRAHITLINEDKKLMDKLKALNILEKKIV